MATNQAVSDGGAEVIYHYIDGGPKACYSFFGSIVVDGSRFHLVLIASRTPGLCRQQFADHLFVLESWKELSDSLILVVRDLGESPALLKSDNSSADEAFALVVNSNGSSADEEDGCPESRNTASTP
jgi:hypothetical protein